MFKKIHDYLYNMKKYWYLLLILVLLSIFLSLKQCNKTEIEEINSWNQSNNIILREKEITDSTYNKLKIENLRSIDSLNKKIKWLEKENLKKLIDLKNYYENEINKVTNTPIDSTVSIRRRQLSEKIDYTKFIK